MSDNSPNLQMPYLMPDQAQKHVTHNEALQRLDMATQLVLSGFASTPPSGPQEGDCYQVTAPASGAFQGQAGQLACFIDGDWLFLTPRQGWIGWLADQGKAVFYTGTSWAALPLPSPLMPDMIGVGATPDLNNRLAVSAAASLFNHRGAGHQLKINRADEAANASLLLQTAFSGRAELGLLANANFALKLSADGTNWKNAIQVSPRGVVSLPAKPICRVHLNTQNLSPPNGGVTGFQSFSINQGEFVLRGDVPSAVGQKLIVPTTGLYRVTLAVLALSSSGHAVTAALNDAGTLVTVKGNATLATLPCSNSAIAQINAGDSIHLQHNGLGQLAFGPGRTELMVEFL